MFKHFAVGLMLGFGCAFLGLFPIILIGYVFVGSLLEHCSAPMARSFELSYYAVPLVGVAELIGGCRKKRFIILFAVGIILSLGAGLIFSL